MTLCEGELRTNREVQRSISGITVAFRIRRQIGDYELLLAMTML
jgi:hypothetical protein